MDEKKEEKEAKHQKNERRREGAKQRSARKSTRREEEQEKNEKQTARTINAFSTNGKFSCVWASRTCTRRTCTRRTCTRRMCTRRMCTRRMCTRRTCTRRTCKRRTCTRCFDRLHHPTRQTFHKPSKRLCIHFHVYPVGRVATPAPADDLPRTCQLTDGSFLPLRAQNTACASAQSEKAKGPESCTLVVHT